MGSHEDDTTQEQRPAAQETEPRKEAGREGGSSDPQATPEGRRLPVCHWYSSSAWSSGRFSVSSLISSSDGRSGVRAPEHLGAEHADQVNQHDVENHRLCGCGSHPDRTA